MTKKYTWNEFRAKHKESGLNAENASKDWAKYKDGKFSFTKKTKTTTTSTRSPEYLAAKKKLSEAYIKLYDLRAEKAAGKEVKKGALSNAVKKIKELSAERKKLR